jgi:CRP-like cAMP-binding protein
MDLQEILAKMLPDTDPKLVKRIAELASIRTLERKEIVFEVGQAQTKLYFLVEGIIRCYFYVGDGTEVTDCFITEPGYPVVMAALNAPSLFAAQAVVDSVLLEIPTEECMEIIKSSNELLWCYNQMLHQALFFHWKIKTSRYCYDAAQRYQWFCQTWPGVDRVANSVHIASFLGITPATLSRLRHGSKETPALTQLLSDPNSDWNEDKVDECLRSQRQAGPVDGQLRDGEEK